MRSRKTASQSIAPSVRDRPTNATRETGDPRPDGESGTLTRLHTALTRWGYRARIPTPHKEVPVRFAARTIVIACLAAAVLVPAAAAADRMWVGFQDDPMFRWDPQRTESMDRARGNEARIIRTVVDWSKVAPDRPASPADSFDPAYKFEDLDELVRNAQQRGMEILITLWGTPK